jgi:hypothetical protein
MLSVKFKEIAWIIVMFLFICFPTSCSDTSYKEAQEKAQFKKNMLRIKLGMTYKDMKLILGNPDITLFSTIDEFNKFNQTISKQELFGTVDTQIDSRTKPGEIDWMYIEGDNANPLGWPVYSFDSNTGKLIRSSRRIHDT